MLSLSLPLPLLILLSRFALSFSLSRISSPSLFLPRPLIPSSLRSRDRVPHSTPLRDPSRSFAPRCPLATSSRPVAWPLACFETLFQPEVPTCIKPLQPGPSITTLHITHYKLPVSFMDYQSRPFSLAPPSILSPSTLPRIVSRLFDRARNRRIYQTRD